MKTRVVHKLNNGVALAFDSDAGFRLLHLPHQKLDMLCIAAEIRSTIDQIGRTLQFLQTALDAICDERGAENHEKFALATGGGGAIMDPKRPRKEAESKAKRESRRKPR